MQELQDKPVLVFLHYFGGSGASWQWVTALLPDYYCFTPDLPGFGGTPPLTNPSVQEMARWVMEEIKKQGIAKYALAGHSMGGKIAVQMAAYDKQEAIVQLILVAPSPPSVEPIPAGEKEHMLRHPDLQEAETNIKKNTIRPLTAAQHKLAIDNNLIADNNTWRWWVNEGTSHSIQDQLVYLHAPVTVVASEDDPAIKFETIQKEVMGLLPHAELVTTKGIGHLSPMEAPEWVAEQIVHTVSK